MRIFRRQNWKLATAHCHRRMDWELIHQFLIHRSIYLTQIFTSNLTLCVKSISSLIKLSSAEQAGKSLFKYNYHNSQMLFKLWTHRKGFQKNTGHVLNRVSMFFQAPTQSLSMTFWTSQSQEERQGRPRKTPPNSNWAEHNFSPWWRSCPLPGTAQGASKGRASAISQTAPAV